MTLSPEIVRLGLAEGARQIANTYRVQGEARARLWENIAKYLETGTAIPIHEDTIMVGAVTAAELTLERLIRHFHEEQAAYWLTYHEGKST